MKKKKSSFIVIIKANNNANKEWKKLLSLFGGKMDGEMPSSEQAKWPWKLV